MVVDRDGERFLGARLPDHVLVEVSMISLGLGSWLRPEAAFSSSSSRMMSLHSSTHSSQMNTRTRDQLAHFVLALAAEGAVKNLAAVVGTALPLVAHALDPAEKIQVRVENSTASPHPGRGTRMPVLKRSMVGAEIRPT
jgi:hypothetical protein